LGAPEIVIFQVKLSKSSQKYTVHTKGIQKKGPSNIQPFVWLKYFESKATGLAVTSKNLKIRDVQLHQTSM